MPRKKSTSDRESAVNKIVVGVATTVLAGILMWWLNANYLGGNKPSGAPDRKATKMERLKANK